VEVQEEDGEDDGPPPGWRKRGRGRAKRTGRVVRVTPPVEVESTTGDHRRPPPWRGSVAAVGLGVGPNRCCERR
jgi:hypothetical protein